MTSLPTMEALVEEAKDSEAERLVCAPAVGVYSQTPRPGQILIPFDRVGRLTVLGRARSLVLPRGGSGRVVECVLRDRRQSVGYGQVLLRLAPVEAEETSTGTTAPAEAPLEALPEGSFAITSPTHGMFYRRPRPDAAPYVEAGQFVQEGNTLALVEVMKCFSAITYGGPGLPARARIVEIRAEDGSEVQAEQVLFIVAPVEAEAPAGGAAG